MITGDETEQERASRHHRRRLFDSVAELYDSSRFGYPADLVQFVVDTARLHAGSSVLEVGCGTGQLTRSLAGFGFTVTAIDIGPSMVSAARRHLTDPAVSFQVTPFEDFEGADGSFDLVVSGTAFHWVDPEARYSKTARLLRRGGWLALLSTAEIYDEPIGSGLLSMWKARSPESSSWVKHPRPLDAQPIDPILFGEPIQRSHAERRVSPAATVVGVENTRATSLNWPAAVREGFTSELRDLLRGHPEVDLTQQTWLAMAQVR